MIRRIKPGYDLPEYLTESVVLVACVGDLHQHTYRTELSPAMRGPLLRLSGMVATASPLRLKTRASLMSGRPCARLGVSAKLMSMGAGCADTSAAKTAAKKRTTDRICNDGSIQHNSFGNQ